MRLLLLALLVACAPAFAACPPSGAERDALFALKTDGFAVPDAARRRDLAATLIDCLGDPDPALRDGIAYEALTHWLRAGDFNAAHRVALRDQLYRLLDGPEGEGYARPFAALVLSEVVRTDRVVPWMSGAERSAMVEKAAGYVEGVRDYRGWDEVQGWRHGVAHGADWLMQLALHPALERAQADRLLAAVAVQAVPRDAHAYVFGEPARLARPVLFVAAHGLHSNEEWQAWFARVAARLDAGTPARQSRLWLARRHDLVAFLQDLYLESGTSEDAHIRALQPAVLDAIGALR
jgi:hypothetical protein